MSKWHSLWNGRSMFLILNAISKKKTHGSKCIEAERHWSLYYYLWSDFADLSHSP